MNEFQKTTKLDRVPDLARLTQKDFDAAEKLLEKLLFEQPTPPPGTRVTTPKNYESDWAFVKLVIVARLLKGNGARFPTVGECREHERKQEAAAAMREAPRRQSLQSLRRMPDET